MLRRGPPKTPRPKKPKDPAKEAARRHAKTLRKVRRIKADADKTDAELSDWEGEFLASLETRIDTYGPAFRDPAKGEVGATLSDLQARKLKEVAQKARGRGPRRTLSTRKERPEGRSSHSEIEPDG
ncbi:MAG: hypothetical protein AAGL49_10040 [Pseudomonadota bacterium]